MSFRNRDEAMACPNALPESRTRFGGVLRPSRVRAGDAGLFDWDTKEYLPIPVESRLSGGFTGDIVLGPDGETVVHVHVVLGRRDGSAMAGHLQEGHVRPTLEIVLTETPGQLRKQLDAASGLPLIRV